jgi:hypothetical protein
VPQAYVHQHAAIADPWLSSSAHVPMPKSRARRQLSAPIELTSFRRHRVQITVHTVDDDDGRLILFDGRTNRMRELSGRELGRVDLLDADCLVVQPVTGEAVGFS